MIAFVDHQDSFSLNIVHALTQAGATVLFLDSREIDVLDLLARSDLEAIILSPGPGHPKDALTAHQILGLAPVTLPILGICLGHQVLALSWGARIERAPRPVHGEVSVVHKSLIRVPSILDPLPSSFEVVRYHSLVAQDLGDELVVTARTSDGLIMGCKRRDSHHEGVQFHPESFATPHLQPMFRTFVAQLHHHGAEQQAPRSGERWFGP